MHDASVDPSWRELFDAQHELLAQIEGFLNAESKSAQAWAPAPEQIFRAFETPVDDVRVVIVGQDPYPTPGNAVGLAFSVAPDISPLPASLRNIYKELAADIGCPPPANGDLSAWQAQGVMLLNRVLTVRDGAAGSHRGRGWEKFTTEALRYLCSHNDTFVAILWGKDAQTLIPEMAGHPVVTSPHPSPLSAHRGFFGSRPFSRANQLLSSAGSTPIDWTLPAS